MIVATEPTSSRTERLHPTDIGTLLGKCSISQLEVALESMMKYSLLYHTKELNVEKGEALKRFGTEFFDKLGVTSDAFEGEIDKPTKSHTYSFYWQQKKWRSLTSLGLLSTVNQLSIGESIVIDNRKYLIIDIENSVIEEAAIREVTTPKVFLKEF